MLPQNTSSQKAPCTFQINITNAGLSDKELASVEYGIQNIFLEAGVDVKFNKSQGVNADIGPYTLNIVRKYPSTMAGFNGGPDAVITEQMQKNALGITLVNVAANGSFAVNNAGYISIGAQKNLYGSKGLVIGLANSGVHEAGRFLLHFGSNDIALSPGVMGAAGSDYTARTQNFTEEQAKALQAHCH